MLRELDENGNVEALKEIKNMKKQIEYWQGKAMENAGFTGEQFRMIRTAIAKDIKDKLVYYCKYHYDNEDNCYITINDAKFYEIFRAYGVDD